jgi:hypothetical protein
MPFPDLWKTPSLKQLFNAAYLTTFLKNYF